MRKNLFNTLTHRVLVEEEDEEEEEEETSTPTSAVNVAEVCRTLVWQKYGATVHGCRDCL